MLINMKMREALKDVREALYIIMSTSSQNLSDITASRAYRKCNEVLTMPLRYCDVYNKEECGDKWWKFCMERGFECDDCPLLKDGSANGCQERFAESIMSKEQLDGKMEIC